MKRKLAHDTAPVPAQMMIAKGADQMQDNPAAAGFSEEGLHNEKILTGRGGRDFGYAASAQTLYDAIRSSAGRACGSRGWLILRTGS